MRVRRFLTLPACAGLLLALAWLAPARADHADHDLGEATLLFEFVSAVADRDLPAEAVAGSGLRLRLANRDALRSVAWYFAAPGLGTLVAERQRQLVSGDGDTVAWIGSLRGAPGGMVSIAERDGVLGGFIDDGKQYWRLQAVGAGLYQIFRLDTRRTPPPANPLLPDTTGESGGGATQGAETTVVQDVMVVYTSEVASRYGGTAATEAAIVSHVEAINQAYQNSQATLQLNLVHMAEVAQGQSGDMGTTLSRLRSVGDGYYDEVHGWRDTYGADLVAMLTTETGYCGIAYLNWPQSNGEAAWAFSVTSAYSGYACLPLTLGHEIGHNQGLCHNREETGCTSPAYPYGYGYRVCGEFRTVMSYSCTGATRVYHFANPAVSYNGFTTGIAHEVDPDNSSEAVRALDDSALDVAAWRASVTDPPAAPSALVADPAGYDRVALLWTDNAADETGFNVERSASGVDGWEVVATLGANTATHTDTGLAADTDYWYRVSAFNGAGASAYSNTEAARTDPPPPPPVMPGDFTATPVSGEQIDLAWTDVAGEVGYRLLRSDDGSTFNEIAELPAGTVAYSDSGLALDTLYGYQVIAFNDSGDSTPAVDWATTLAHTDVAANGESTVHGSRSGSYADTAADDGVAETITEVETNGNPSRRTSRLEHRWSFDVSAGGAATVIANVWKSGGKEDDFLFEYAPDGSTWTKLFTVSSTDVANIDSAPLPLGIAGAIEIRVVDTDRTGNHTALDSVHVEQLVVRVQAAAGGTAPDTPTNLSASAVSSSQIGLTWTDVVDETGYALERSDDSGSTWELVETLAADTTAYTDSGLAASTTYHYRLNAYNAAGASAWAAVEATTPIGPNITLSASGYKIKGVQHADLSWDGIDGAASLSRDGTPVYEGPANIFTDNIGNKGGGSYEYRVCDAISGECSDSVTVAF